MEKTSLIKWKKLATLKRIACTKYRRVLILMQPSEKIDIVSCTSMFIMLWGSYTSMLCHFDIFVEAIENWKIQNGCPSQRLE